MSQIALELSRSIKENKWVSIEYDNKNEKKHTYFWIAIKDIHPVSRKMKVDMFNQEYSNEVLEATIAFDQIIAARVIEGTICEVQEALIDRILNHFQEYAFLEYLGINERILNYYAQCYRSDRDSSIRNYALVNGIDSDTANGTPFVLPEKMWNEILTELKSQLKFDKKTLHKKVMKFAINRLSIMTRKGLYPIVYRELLLDVKAKSLKINAFDCFNIKMSDHEDQVKFNLATYCDIPATEFMNHFQEKQQEYIENIQSNLRRNEIIDERPYVYNFETFFGVNIDLEYEMIQQHYLDSTLCAPLRIFFGMNEKEKKRKGKAIFIHDAAINMDQLRSVYNAMIRNMVYVQGPPGTGKTTTIVNVILSALVNDMCCLIVSNNNEAIDNIYRKCRSFTYLGQRIPFPIIRLGSKAKIKESLALIFQESIRISRNYDLNLIDAEVEAGEAYLQELFGNLQELLQAYEEKSEINEQVDSLKGIMNEINRNEEADEYAKSLAIAGIRAQMDHLNDVARKSFNEDDVLAHLTLDYERLDRYLTYKSLSYYVKFTRSKNEILRNIFLIRDEEARYKSFASYLREPRGLKSLSDCFPFVVSTNVSCAKLGRADPIFDLLIMDEASQCSNAVALMPLARSKRALLVGDQNQLQPVVVMNEIKNAQLVHSYDIPSSYDYKHNSILSTLLKIDPLSKFILLHEHYRCNDKIINFSNQKYYDNELKLCSQLSNIDALKLIDVKSSFKNERNTSQEEVKCIVQEIKNSNTRDIAVITPFRKQANLISKTLNELGLDYVKVGTIHTFQGDEKQKIILSSGISEGMQSGSYNWLKNNQELLNVATTRAKENLVLVTDVSQVKELSKNETNDFCELVDYMMKDGNYQVAYRENEVFTSKVKNFKYYNTKSEEEFLATLMHIKSIFGAIHVMQKVKVSDVLDLTGEESSLFVYGNQAHFDFVLYDMMKKPLLAIEVMGVEHYNDLKVRARDEKKKLICEANQLKLLSIRNDYVRRYSYIKEVIIDVLTN